MFYEIPLKILFQELIITRSLEGLEAPTFGFVPLEFSQYCMVHCMMHVSMMHMHDAGSFES